MLGQIVIMQRNKRRHLNFFPIRFYNFTSAKFREKFKIEKGLFKIIDCKDPHVAKNKVLRIVSTPSYSPDLALSDLLLLNLTKTCLEEKGSNQKKIGRV